MSRHPGGRASPVSGQPGDSDGPVTGGSGLRLHYVTKGPPEAPLLLLLHGFPQTWYCWRHLLRELGSSFQVVALDLPGCGASEKPPGRDSYQLELLRDGSAAPAKCTLVGHDWGGLLAWEVACSHPALVQSLVLMAAPQRGAMAAFSLCHPSQLLRSSYAFLFQLPWLPELLLSLADFELVRTVMMSPWLGVQNPAQRLTEEDLEVYLYSLSQPGGLSPPIHYYRNLFRDSPIPREPPPPPTLLLWGSHDAFLDPRLVPVLSHRLRPGASIHLLPGASHWLPEDQPQALAHILRTFLAGGHQHP
ncbi:epoxide hydrolase 3-like [Indicator indicator]|uniref:epoxide hydrolase 3-like n=1 Tax=Indicator indicator TaxID=1002788 RepID=UPI0023DFD8B7|nr:epoxide hydrolase 3-like [Indicator indicator]